MLRQCSGGSRRRVRHRIPRSIRRHVRPRFAWDRTVFSLSAHQRRRSRSRVRCCRPTPLEGVPGRLPSTEPAVALALLREASADNTGLWIGYADADGRTTRILFYPKRIEGGRAYGSIEGSDVERAFSIHRITGAAFT